jgi:hypothetical protein
LLYSPGWTQTRDPPCSASRALGLQACTAGLVWDDWFFSSLLDDNRSRSEASTGSSSLPQLCGPHLGPLPPGAPTPTGGPQPVPTGCGVSMRVYDELSGRKSSECSNASS